MDQVHVSQRTRRRPYLWRKHSFRNVPADNASSRRGIARRRMHGLYVKLSAVHANKSPKTSTTWRLIGGY